MKAAAMVWPGITGTNWQSALLISFYSVIDGVVFGAMFAAIYNRLMGRL